MTMAIKTSTFGGVTLSGNAAKQFQKQFLSPNAKPNPAAQRSLKQGRVLLKQYLKKGYITVKAKI